jgi:Mg2+-importing ATPase
MGAFWFHGLAMRAAWTQSQHPTLGLPEFDLAGERRSDPATLLCAAASSKVSVVLKSLGTTLDGLSWAEVQRRRQEFGFNEISRAQPAQGPIRVLSAFKSSFISLLAVLGAVALFDNDYKAALLLAAAVLYCALAAYLQECRLEASAERPESNAHLMIKVTRSRARRPGDGPRTWEAVRALERHGQIEIPARDLVPGDIVDLSADTVVPADVRIVLCRDFFVDESALTRQAIPVKKSESIVERSGTIGHTTGSLPCDPPSLPNICFSGTTVVSGNATAVVLATGELTYSRSPARELASRRPVTGLRPGGGSQYARGKM